MSIAICDPESFFPLRRLVSGPFNDLQDVQRIERFIRTVVLHDEVQMIAEPWPYDPKRAESDQNKRAWDLMLSEDQSTEETAQWITVHDEDTNSARIQVTGFYPNLAGYEFFTPLGEVPTPDIDLAPCLVDLARSRSGDDEMLFQAHVAHLQLAISTVSNGGSALLCGDFGSLAVDRAGHYPEALFARLDETWHQFARGVQTKGLGPLIPPVLGIVLSRCARREAIPYVVRELRDEWAGGRRHLWRLLTEMRVSRTLGEAYTIEQELRRASELFALDKTEIDSRPARVLWEILAGGAAGAAIAYSSGVKPVLGATALALTQAARSLPPFIHEFGTALFGRGAFDLARRVRRSATRVEMDALGRLLSDPEKRNLGIA